MQSLPKHPILEWPPNALTEIRKIHNLHTPERIQEAVTILKDWIHKQDHFLKKDYSEEYLERCLISNKGSVEKTKKQIDALCTMKTMLPHFFTMHNVKQELKAFPLNGCLVALPKLTNDFSRIILYKLHGKKFTEKFIMEYFLFGICCTEYIKAHDYSNGFTIVYDLQEANIKNLFVNINPVMYQQYNTTFLEGYGARVKGIHFVTQSKTIDLLVKFCKQIVSPKIAQRVFVHKTLQDLHLAIPKDLLPEDYGGKEKTIKELSNDWVEEFSTDENIAYLKMSSRACTNENLRRSDKFNDKYMGMPGSFRQLNVD